MFLKILSILVMSVLFIGCQTDTNTQPTATKENNSQPTNNQNQITKNNNNGEGTLYGEGYSFKFKAPKGWILDTKSASEQGMHAVFYPENETWKDSPIIAYARSYGKDEVKTIEQLVEKNITGFRQNGSPDSKAKKIKEIKIDENKTAVIYHYTGDQWGNLEAVGYIEEKNSINYFVLNARNKVVFDNSLEALEELVKSYKLVLDEELKDRENESKNQDGKNY